MNKPQTRCVWR